MRRKGGVCDGPSEPCQKSVRLSPKVRRTCRSREGGRPTEAHIATSTRRKAEQMEGRRIGRPVEQRHA
jgi:hypothetical protein